MTGTATGTETSTDPAWFDRLYVKHGDPWQVRTRWYERRKRAVLLACLPRERYASAYEPGCGTGDLTLALAARCDAVLASDFSAPAVDIARTQAAPFSHVKVQQQRVPQQWPEGRFDLIVVSEWAYYVSHDDLLQLARRCRASLTDDGTLVACHWRPGFPERTHDTEAIHAMLGGEEGLTRLLRYEDADFLLEAWSPQARSVCDLDRQTKR